MPKKIVCIGDVVLDILPSIFPIMKEKILLDGETFVDSITFQKGGCAGNFACVLKSIMPEHEVSLVSRVGKLPYSEQLISEIKKFGVTPLFQLDSDENTQATVAVSYSDGQRHFLTYLGGLKNFTIQDIPGDAFVGIHHLAFRGIWFVEKLLLQSEIFIKEANELGVDVSIDLGFDPYWNSSKQERKFQENLEKRRLAAVELLKYVKFIFGNESEIMNLTNTESVEAATQALINYGAKNIIIHRGEKGCRIIQLTQVIPTNQVSSVDIPALKVDIKNPVGSGDTFDGIFIAEVLEGKSIVQSAALATAGAAFSLMHPAGTILTMEEVIQFSSKFPEISLFLLDAN